MRGSSVTVSVVSTRVGRRVPQPDELGEKPPGLFAVDDAGEGSVLAEEAHAGMQHDGHQEACLALSKPEVRNGLDALFELHQ